MLTVVHFADSVPGFWTWLAAHWPAAPHGCQWQYGRGPGQALHWLRICHTRPGLRSWPVLVHPARIPTAAEELHRLMRAVVSGKTFGIDGHTYVARVVR